MKNYNVPPEKEIWVLDTEGKVRSSEEVFLSDKYNPLYNWQKLNLPEMKFLSEEYLNFENDPEGWRNFLKETSMKGYCSASFGIGITPGHL